MKKIFNSIKEFFALLLGVDCKVKRDAVDENICDFSGQGRDSYGK